MPLGNENMKIALLSCLALVIVCEYVGYIDGRRKR